MTGRIYPRHLWMKPKPKLTIEKYFELKKEVDPNAEFWKHLNMPRVDYKMISGEDYIYCKSY